MTPQQIKTLYDWALIHEYARGKVSAAMMEEVEKMDRALGEFCPCRSSVIDTLPLTTAPSTPNLDGMPEEVRRFARASLDPGCSSCWLSSKIDGTHQECQAKIEEWFDAREALIAFGLKLDTSEMRQPLKGLGMLDPQTIILDKYNVWRKVWYIPTPSELYITDYDGHIVAKYCRTYRKGEWPMQIFQCVANTSATEHKEAIESIVRAWEARILDLVDTNIQSQHRRSAILDE